jgi:hypothetical protein
VLQIGAVADDGFSTSIALSSITTNGNNVVRRSFARNTGYTTFTNGIAANREFIFRISPSSVWGERNFPPISIPIKVKTAPGEIEDPVLPFALVVLVFSILTFVALLVWSIVKLKCFSWKRAVAVD